MKKSPFFPFLMMTMLALISGCAPAAAPSRVASASPMHPSLAATVTPPPGSLLPVRGLWVQFERRGWGSEYWPGQVIQQFHINDELVGHTVGEEVALQLDQMKQLGVNTIAFELRSADPPLVSAPSPCYIGDVLGLQYPSPTALELKNLADFFDLAQSKDMQVFLMLTNTHMEEQPPANNALWLSAILNAVRDHPALGLVEFNGTPQMVDTDGDGVNDTCGTPAEPPLWDGPGSVSADYVQWAIQYSHSLGIPYQKLSAEAIVGDYYMLNQGPAGPEATDRHQWDPVFTLKSIFDNLNVPEAERVYSISWYEHRKCELARNLACVDADPNAWAIETATHVFDTIGRGHGARVVATEMGLSSARDKTWTTEMALASLVGIMQQFGIEGGCFWRWTDFDNSEESDPQLASAIKKRGKAFSYNPVAQVLKQLYTQGRLTDPNFDPAALATAAALTPEVQAATLPDDTFDGIVLDSTKWRTDVTLGAVLHQDDRLIISSDGTQTSAGASVTSNWVFPGDFDVQVDFDIGKGWSAPASGYLEGVFFSADIVNRHYWITRRRSLNQNAFMGWATTGALQADRATDVVAGKFRLVRVGTSLTLFFDAGQGWQQLSSMDVPLDSARVVMGSASQNTSQALTAYFDNFHINSGQTTYRP